jgi:signal transduction histidine kinase
MFDSFTATEAALSERNAARTADASQRARTAAAACAGVLLLLVALFLVYVARLITAPIRRVSAAAGALAAGEYSVRVPTTGAGEVEGLAHSFNDMAESLERAVSIVRTFYEFGESVAGETEMEPLAATIVEGLCRAGGADGATMHALVEDLDERFEFEHVATYGRTEPVGRELSLPLLHGDDAMLGVVTLCWADDAAAPDEEALSHLAGQAAVAWATATALARARRAATINRAVLAAARDSITLADRDGRVILRNPRAEAALPIYGISGATIQETTDALAERIVDPEPYREWIQRTRVDADYAGEYDFCLIESERSFQSVTSPVRDVDGEIIGRLFIVRETTAERETERLKTELVSTVSHELRTPLASIMGFTELLLARETDEQTRRQYLGTVYAEGKRLTGLVNQFLDFQRIERGELELHIDSVDLGMVVRDAAAAVEPQSVDHEIAVTVDDARLTVRADDERMRQVVANLLSNAIKYSPAGGRVALGACRTNGAVRVEVRDDGVGIPSAQQEGVFEKFFRADRSDTRSMGGAGLGLALCREIVEAHGGRIGFESRDGQGSTFWFEVPAESAA